MTGLLHRILWRLFPWEPVFEAGIWLYEQHRFTGARRARPLARGGLVGPQDGEWLARLPPRTPTAPRGGSAVLRPSGGGA